MKTKNVLFIAAGAGLLYLALKGKSNTPGGNGTITIPHVNPLPGTIVVPSQPVLPPTQEEIAQQQQWNFINNTDLSTWQPWASGNLNWGSGWGSGGLNLNLPF